MKKKVILYVFLFLIITLASFTVGALIASFRHKSSNSIQEKTVIINNFNESQKQTNEENKGEEIQPTSPVSEENLENPEAASIPTPPEFSFAILGDTQYFKPGGSGGYQSAMVNIKKNNPELVFGMGDLVSSCDGTSECQGKLGAWRNLLGSLSSKTYVMQGNHDRTGKEKADSVWERVFSYLPTNGPQGFSRFAYSFDFENSHFVVLDSDKPKENDINKTQLDWLDQDLARNKKDNTFVFFHEPAYPTNSKIGESLDESSGDRDRLWNILTKYKSRAVFSGHEHIQSRRKVNGLYQFVFGNTDSFNHEAPKPGMAEYSYIGQAFGIVKVAGKDVTVNTFSVSGSLLNSFKIPN